jgi:DNA-directed RNA polymerase subunit RPC12/RpoP
MTDTPVETSFKGSDDSGYSIQECLGKNPRCFFCGKDIKDARLVPVKSDLSPSYWKIRCPDCGSNVMWGDKLYIRITC